MTVSVDHGMPGFAPLLRRHRARAGLTQRELAERSGVSAAAIRDLEQGRSLRPRPCSMRAIVDALGLTHDEADALRNTTQYALTDPVPPVGPRGPVTVGVLGPIVVHRDGVQVSLGTGRHVTVLGRLALSPNTVVHRDDLVDLLWGARMPPSAINVVQTYVSRLRRALQPFRGSRGEWELLAYVRAGYRLNVSPNQLDLLRFRELVTRSADTTPERALVLLDEALNLWRGDIDVDDLRGSPLVAGLTEEYLAAVIRHAEAALTVAAPQRALPRLRELAGRYPLHETLWARLMAVLAATGRQADALTVYDEIRRRLADDLGIDPGQHLVRAQRDVLHQRCGFPAL